MATFVSKVNPTKNNGTNPTPPAWAFADSAAQSTAGATGAPTTTLTPGNTWVELVSSGCSITTA